MIFLQLIFIIFIVIAFSVAFTLYRTYRKAHDVMSRIRGKMNGGSRQDGNHEWQNRTTKYDDVETITDHRDPQETVRKIFPRNEGEYVDYQEEDK